MTTTQTTITGNAAGPCPACGFMVAVEGRHGAPGRATCPQCGAMVRLTWVVGTFNGKIPCNADCQYARGPRCSCSCGGENHRVGYIPTRVVPAWVRERDAKAHEDKVAKASARKDKAAKANADQLAEQMAATPELGRLDDARYRHGLTFAWEMRQLVAKGKPLTDKQLAAVVRMVRNDDDWERRDAERELADLGDQADRATGWAVCDPRASSAPRGGWPSRGPSSWPGWTSTVPGACAGRCWSRPTLAGRSG